MKRVLVTGGLGYLGGRLVQALLRDEELLVRVGSKRIAYEKLPNWLCKQDIVQMDMLSEEDMESACSEVDYIIHLAALNEIECAKKPDIALLVNGYGTMKLAEAAAKNGVKRIIYMSTAHVYAAPLIGCFDEESIPQPRHPYSISKRVGEDFILAQPNLEKIIIRLSNAFGKPVYPDINRWGLVVNDFCRQAVNDKQIIIKSSGKQHRNFIPFGDVTNAVAHLLRLKLADNTINIFNLGGETMSILEMAQLVASRCEAVMGYMPTIFVEGKEKENLHEGLCYSCSKLNNTNWVSTCSISAEIDELLLYCQKIKS
ncbi:NAD-dependent epimerase/dehydratase family protein [Anaeroarcus burkinensis]|uniref:NAD-dependent epimerase/dehydratase family protein n=1 Tax=Anaeroarcus burkinensis TaxID=82376 RepID=UPI00041B8DBA|nr:SDR family oxidoreductase [Anaeroarcus burkinensis]